MGTFLFDKIIFGPVKSRRLGQSLGINLLPVNSKLCNFDCIYCECGLSEKSTNDLPSRKEVESKLKEVLFDFSQSGKRIDSITFAGNGEPTLHPEFGAIIDDTYRLRNSYFPKARIALLTNSTTVINHNFHKAFRKIDQNIFKIDSVHPDTIKILNQPLGNYNLEKIIESMRMVENRIVQTMFIRGIVNGQIIDNTTEQEISLWLDALGKIKPVLVMIYTIERDTPIESLQKISPEDLRIIAEKVRKLGLEVQISE
jgi:wyosine [tRNA(Phe)-imidazoG37] synthetase (radical SAM superfamily)